MTDVHASVSPHVGRVFGREAEVRRLVALLEPGVPALVTITGRGGVGKTALAAEVVRALDGPTPCTWVPLAGVIDPKLVVSAIATALGASPQPGADVTDVVLAELRHGSPLLVLDNAEHLLAAAPVLGDLLARSPALRMLVTSQAPLRLQAERVIALAALPLPSVEPGTSPEELVEQPAVAAYCQRAAAVDRSFVLTDANADAVVELCRRLEGLPLAIELAAARAATLPAGAILPRLGDAGLGVLQRDRADVPMRHHGVRAAIGWTYDLLDPGEQRALRHLSATVGTIGLDAAIELIHGERDDDPSGSRALDELSALVDFHLVDPLPGADPPRFSLPDSIRAYGRAEASRLGEEGRIERLRIRVRARQARTAAEGTETGRAEQLVVAIEADRDDLLAALGAATDLGLADDALDLARGLGAYWDLRGYGSAQAELLEAALELSERTSADPSRRANATLWSAFLGVRHLRDVDQSTMVERIARAEDLATLADDAAARFHAQCVRLLVAPYTGDVVGAVAATEEGLRLAEEHGNEGWRSIIQVWAGMLAQVGGDEERAVELGMAALEGARRSGDRETVLRAVMLLGPLADRFPDRVRGLPSTEEAIVLARDLGLAFYEALLVLRRTEEALRVADVEGALHWMAATLEMARTMVSSPVVGFDLIALVRTADACGDPGHAAFFHGTIEGSLPLIERFLPEAQVAKYRTVVEAVRATLGDEEFDRQVHLGAQLSWGEAVEQAITYVASHAPGDGEPGETAARPGSPPAPIPTPLTARQMEVLRLLARGLANKEIAVELGLRPKTVMHYTTAIYRSLGVRGRTEATAAAFRMHLVD